MSSAIEIGTIPAMSRSRVATAARTPREAQAVSTQPTTRLRITARGRVVLTTIAALPVVAVAIALSLNGGGAVATATGSSTPLESITVMGGQSLWQLAEEIAPQADPREVIADLISINTLVSAEVHPGQQLDIPSEYSH
ncbi:MAG: conserved secreted protein [Glaciihabitans sp.]|nr:conserved secreted protein [Glaciihabitans sp.]